MRRPLLALLAALVLAALLPGLASAAKKPQPRLQGLWNVTLTTTATDVAGVTPGRTSDTSFLFTPLCRRGACDVRVKLDAGLGDSFLTFRLSRSGSSYTGRVTFPVDWLCAGGVVTDGGVFTVELELKVTRSATTGAKRLATQLRGTGAFDAEATPEALAAGSCAPSPDSQTQAFAVVAAPMPKLSGPRLEGTWHASGRVTSARNSELVLEPPGVELGRTWTLTPICARGPCDVLASVVPDEGLGLPLPTSLQYQGGGVYSGRASIVVDLLCGAGAVHPALVGIVEFTLTVTAQGGGLATGADIDAVIRADQTPELLDSGCGLGAIESISEYTALPLLEAIG